VGRPIHSGGLGLVMSDTVENRMPLIAAEGLESKQLMVRHVAAGIKLVFGLHHPGRNLKVFDDDVFLVSYSKSGNTWARFLVANLVYPHQSVDFANINELTPDPEALSKRHLARVPRPRIIKSHQYFDPRYRHVVYIVRDPRDVALSEYHFRRKRRVLSDAAPIEEFVNRFVTGEITPYGSWGENVASWIYTRRGNPGFLLLRYEDMLENTLAELEKIAAFLKIDAVRDRLVEAVTRSSAQKMRELEKSQAHLWSTTKQTRSDMPFVRVAKAGSWRSELPRQCVAQIERAWGEIMRELNYPLTADDQKLSPADIPAAISQGGD
jgi:hypothetical protein